MNNYRIHYFGPMLFQSELSNEQAASIENLLNKTRKQFSKTISWTFKR